MSHPQQIVQACHAISEATRFYPPPEGVIPNLVVVGVNDESRLFSAADKLRQAEIKFVIFQEPDRNDEATAIATEPLFSLDKRKLLRNFQLLK